MAKGIYNAALPPVVETRVISEAQPATITLVLSIEEATALRALVDQVTAYGGDKEAGGIWSALANANTPLALNHPIRYSVKVGT